MIDHVYVSFASPPSSLPMTESEAVLPVMGAPLLTEIGCATVGAVFVAIGRAAADRDERRRRGVPGECSQNGLPAQ